MKHGIPLAALAALAACSQGKSGATGAAFDPTGLRAAEARLVAHLQGDDSLAWVADYTEDAVFQEGEAPPVSGRAALTELAKSLGPLSSVSIEPVRTVGQGNLAYVQVHASYAAGKGPDAGPVGHYSGVMIWRKDADGQWRMLHELLVAEKASKGGG